MVRDTTRRDVLQYGAVAGTALVAGCLGDDGDDDEDAGGDEGSYETMLSIPSLEFPFFARMEEGFEQAQEEHDVTGTFSDAQNDESSQIGHVENAITQDVDFVMVSPITEDGIVPAIEQANEADTPVVTIDRNAASGDIASYVASDNVGLGRDAVELCLELMQDIEERDTYNLVELQGTQGASVTNDREEGGQEVIDENDDLDLIASDDGDFSNTEAVSVMENFLTSHGNDIDGVYCHNDLMAEGVHEVLVSQDVTDVPVVGIDGEDAWAELIRENEHYATVAQLPEEMVLEAVDAGIRTLEGEDVDDEVLIEGVEVTHENADEYLDEYF